ncbi:MAG: manganese-dependent inorganic pyrophosphatase [Candidatus Moranbacteria bacterium CG23_combo_of_CG06-09_8_20_14_all_39_10]|nr:MAG: manganese-dependent inorganic pyrophosphatase [Candidatus Moranbacteria bacterium CG23_combo_of_CG06-09_8_20_14_all_39_10]
MKKIIIIGHKNPDTDSIVSSSIAEHYFKNILKIDAKACCAGELNNETKFVLNQFGVQAPQLLKTLKSDDKIILVDHNEFGQAIDGLQVGHIERIVDHHKLTMQTEQPIFVRIDPIGSTASVLAKMYAEAGKKIPTNMAKLMLAGILSDTLNLNSPTTTAEDKKLVKELNKLAKLNLKEFVADLFAAKSSLQGISLETLITQDYKDFKMGKYKVGIAVWETTNPESVLAEKENLIKLLAEKKAQDKLDRIIFMLVDIIKQNSLLFIVSEEEQELLKKVFARKISGNEMFLPGVVSRKKQIVPQLTEALSK